MLVSTIDGKNILGKYLNTIQNPYGLNVIYLTSMGEVNLVHVNDCRVFANLNDMDDYSRVWNLN